MTGKRLTFEIPIVALMLLAGLTQCDRSGSNSGDPLDATLAYERKLANEDSEIDRNCAAAAASAVSPNKALNFTFQTTPAMMAKRLPSRASHIAHTSTGFATPINADIGGRIVNFECYLDSNRKVTNLSYVEEYN